MRLFVSQSHAIKANSTRAQRVAPFAFMAFTNVFIAAFISCSAFSTIAVGQLLTGADVLSKNDFNPLQQKRLALISNSTTLNNDGVSTLELFQKHQLDLRVIFAPEHGFESKAEAGKIIADNIIKGKENHKVVQVISLYGKTKKPTREMLSEVDALVFDIQDIGARCYTYISTMKLAMQAASESGKEFIVLDRPNPISPIEPDGFMLNPNFESFVGMVPVPFIHSLTIGEIATLIQREDLPTLALTVVKMQQYNRTLFDDEREHWRTRFQPPSPNIQSINAMLLYPATVFIEGTNVSEGRGTDTPFELIGAPFIDGDILKKEIGTHNGLVIESISFVPQSLLGKSQSPKFLGQRCNGVRFVIQDRRQFKPFQLGVAILTSLNRLYPKEFIWSEAFFDKLAGTDEMRKLIQQGKSMNQILIQATLSRQSYLQKQKNILLY